MLTDFQIDIPNAPVIGMQLRFDFEGVMCTHHYQVATEEGCFWAVEPTYSLDTSDLREANGIKPTQEYVMVLRQQTEFLSGLKRPRDQFSIDPATYPFIRSIAELKQRIERKW